MPDTATHATRAAFPLGPSAMHAAVRGFDWAATPLGPIGAWPVALRAVVATVLDTRQPMFLVWGPARTAIYNDAYAPILGARHPAALGRPFQDIWPEAWDAVEALVARAMGGEAIWQEDMPFVLERHGNAEPAWFSFFFGPARDEGGVVRGMLAAVTETTYKVLAERRLHFLLELEKELRPIGDPRALFAAAMVAVGRELAVQHAGYALVEDDDETVDLHTPYAQGAPPPSGRHKLAGFGEGVVGPQRRGLSVFRTDIAEDPTRERAVWEALGVRAFVSVPLVRQGRLRATLFVTTAAPRRWLPAEVALLEDVASRTWDAVERARAEALLRTQAGQLRSMFEQAPTFMALLEGPEHRFVNANPAYMELVGQRKVIGRTVADALPEAREQGYLTLLDQVFRSGDAYAAQGVPIALRGGDERFLDFVYQPLRDEQGQVSGIFVLGADMTERTRAEAALRALNADLEQRVVERAGGRGVTWQVSPYLLAVIGASGAFEMVNPAWTSTLGWDEARMVGVPYPEFLHPDDLERSRAAFEVAIAGEPVLGFENRYRHRDGGYRWLSWTAVPEEGRIFCTARDVTEEKERAEALALTQEALRQSQKMEAMGQLTGGVAHDFNNLLTPILGSLDMLSARGLGNERERRLIDGALQSAERARTLVQRLLAFARRQPLQPEAVDLGALVQGMAELIATTTGPQIAVRVALPAALPPVMADAGQLEMAILNLVVNARDAMAEGGALTLSAACETVRSWHPAQLARGAYVRLTVADTGTGMDEATRARATEPFFSTKGVGKGTGLGLSMVHGLAVQLGGTVTLDSTPGTGTRVDIWLPVTAEAVRAPDNAAPAAATPSAGTALLVDDEELVRMSTAFMLAELGYAVTEVASAQEALERIEAGLAPDLLVTDHVMPGMTGAELARAVRARQPGLPVLLVSGYAEAEGIAADLPRLLKPFRQAELEAALRDLVGRG